MCGLIGWVAPEGGLDPGVLERALARLAHRGPDGRGQYVSADRRVALGHTRLAVVSRADGAQPLSTRDGSVHAVVNGEIYDDRRLRTELEARGHVFATRSDSEVLLHLYAERGLDMMSDLRGELAFVLHDVRRGVVIAGRDRFGIKPLVWTAHQGGILFASEAKALFAMGVPARWDTTSFLHAVSHQYLPPTRTMFHGVQALAPAHVVEIDVRTGRARTTRYWAPELSQNDVRASDLAHAARGVREALETSVALRLRADRRPCFHLSGGLDSASIVALAQRHLDVPARCFAIQFDDPRYAEGALAQETASALGAELEVVETSTGALLDALPDAIEAGETLGINGQLPAKLLLARAIRRAGFEVVLSGEGSDEAFLGYPHLALDDARARGVRLDPPDASPLQRGVMLPEGAALPTDAVARALGYVPSFLEAKAGIGARMHALLRPEVRAACARRDPFAGLVEGFDVGLLAARPRAAQSAWLWTELALAGYILRALGDGCEMAASIEGRVPFLDHPLFERALALPVTDRIAGDVQKHALREAMRGVLPEAVRVRRKHPFLAPPVAGARDPRVRDRVRALLSPARLARVPFVDVGAVGRWLDRLDGADEALARREDPVLHLLLGASCLGDRFALSDEVRA